MNREEKIQEAKKLQTQYLHERASGLNMESLVTERKYIVIRKELIDEVTAEVVTKKSIPINKVKDIVSARPKKPKRATGIQSLDMELVHETRYGHGDIGGFSLGNFIQIAGERGSGKTTMMIKILAGISNHETVSWFNFEMSDDKAITILEQYRHDSIEYYDGSRELLDITDEIKYLYADGVRHFLIDSMMKISANGYKRGYESFSHISSKLAELTSTLGVNIYLIQQMSSESQRNGTLMMKHGNDAEYDADYMFFMVKAVTGEKDEAGQLIIDDSKRFLVCTKNRPDHRLFNVEIHKQDIASNKAVEIEYEY